MRIHEFMNSSKEGKSAVKKSNLLYEKLPTYATQVIGNPIVSMPMIYGIDDYSEPNLCAHAKLNTLAYQKMKNWD